MCYGFEAKASSLSFASALSGFICVEKSEPPNELALKRRLATAVSQWWSQSAIDCRFVKCFDLQFDFLRSSAHGDLPDEQSLTKSCLHCLDGR